MKKQHLATIPLITFASALLAAGADSTNAPPAAKPAQPVVQPAATPAVTEPTPTNGFALNFHDVPLNTVLTYLSAKAGLIIVSDVNLQGKVSVVAQQPITTNDIVSLLNDQLGKNNYSAMLEGRTLTIMDSERAKTYAATPVKIANGFSNIPMDDQTVTEILPLHTLVAKQLIKDLEPVTPHGATMTANEAGNSLIMTAPQKDVRRIAQIINALDGSALSEVEVFSLQYADSKSVADELKEVFQTADSDITRANARNNFRGPHRWRRRRSLRRRRRRQHRRCLEKCANTRGFCSRRPDERGCCQRAAGLHAHDQQRHRHTRQTEPGGHRHARLPLEACRCGGNRR